MNVLVVGASGATGRLLVIQLLRRNIHVKAIVRNPDALPNEIKSNKDIVIIKASINDVQDLEMEAYMKDCEAVISCLGHNLTLKGIFGKPHLLVTDAMRKICRAINNCHPKTPVKLILMNTTGNRNLDIPEKFTTGENIIISLLRILLPPQRDNENAANYLRKDIGKNNANIEWVVVRPDTLINEQEISEYSVFPSPNRSALFNAGKTSRINVGHFMAELIMNNDLWNTWKSKMPVIYNNAVK